MVDMTGLIGSIRRFGLVGPPYEVVGPADTHRGGEQQMRVRLIESGELVDYPVAHILADPLED